MRLDKILENIKAADSAVSSSDKVASDKSGVAASTRDQLLAALNSATADTKTASVHNNPVDDLMKIASDVAATEQEMAIKEAQLLGRAFADAVVSRVGEWQSAAVKTASANAESGFDKFASENVELVKQAAELGYRQTKEHLEKVAAAEYDRGYNDTMAEVQKLAAVEFAKAANVTGQILDAIAAG